MMGTYTVYDYDFEKLKKEKLRVYCDHKWYRLIFSGFDIETTKVPQKDGTYRSYMYHWQLSLNNDDILGRTWEECVYCFKKITDNLNLKKNERMLMLIANEGFEFQFFRKRFRITKLFAKEKRQPLICEIDEKIEIRDAIAISGLSLANIAKNYCKTQKLVGDLDYDKLRNSKTYMDRDTEIQYCINDVRILAEYSEYLFGTYIQNGFIPSTKTSIVRNDVKVKIKETTTLKKVYKMISKLMPESLDDYNFTMKYLFRGGLTHCNARYTGQILYDVESWDKKSSYPYVMFNKLYPVTPFKNFDTSLFYEKINEDIDAIIFIGKFRYLEAKSTHTTLSYHKSVVRGKKLIDNGRIFYAEECVLYLTEIDFKSMKKFYNWQNLEILECKFAKKGRLPKFLLDVCYDYFFIKETTPKDTCEYTNNKTKLNATFGMTVTRYCTTNWTYTDDWKISSNENYIKWRNKQFLSPYWGIYITSWARYDLEQTINFNKTVYYDTDSNKILGKNYKFFEKINKEIEKENRETCERFGYDFRILKDIGKYQYEGTYKRFKSLGSKRYITEKDGKIESTVSGLGKKSVINEAKKRGVDAFEIFSDGMEISPENVGKLITSYCDDAHEDIVDGELMHEESSVSLYEQSSHLNIDIDYYHFINYLKNKIERGILQ